jgi:hypothetical protein
MNKYHTVSRDWIFIHHSKYYESVMLCSGGYCVIFVSLSFCGGTETSETFSLKMECVRVGEYILIIKQLSGYFLIVDNI